MLNVLPLRWWKGEAGVQANVVQGNLSSAHDRRVAPEFQGNKGEEFPRFGHFHDELEWRTFEKEMPSLIQSQVWDAAAPKISWEEAWLRA